MGKREELKTKLKPILNDPRKLQEFLLRHSNLPGRRANLELMHAFADTNEDLALVKEWVKISEHKAEENDPKAFLAYCATVSLGQIYANTKNEELLPLLKELANDGRWRMRECIAFSFHRIGEEDFSHLQEICTEWLHTANCYEKRCILVSLAHPLLLDEERAIFCLNIANTILKSLDEEKSESFRVLRKGLEFTISFYVQVVPEKGFQFLNSWIGKSDVIDEILKANLAKKRLFKNFPQKVTLLLDFLEIK